MKSNILLWLGWFGGLPMSIHSPSWVRLRRVMIVERCLEGWGKQWLHHFIILLLWNHSLDHRTVWESPEREREFRNPLDAYRRHLATNLNSRIVPPSNANKRVELPFNQSVKQKLRMCEFYEWNFIVALSSLFQWILSVWVVKINGLLLLHFENCIESKCPHSYECENVLMPACKWDGETCWMLIYGRLIDFIGFSFESGGDRVRVEASGFERSFHGGGGFSDVV